MTLLILAAAGIALAATGIAAIVLAATGGTAGAVTVAAYILGASFTVSGAVMILAVWITYRDRGWISSRAGNGKGPDA